MAVKHALHATESPDVSRADRLHDEVRVRVRLDACFLMRSASMKRISFSPSLRVMFLSLMVLPPVIVTDVSELTVLALGARPQMKRSFQRVQGDSVSFDR